MFQLPWSWVYKYSKLQDWSFDVPGMPLKTNKPIAAAEAAAAAEYVCSLRSNELNPFKPALQRLGFQSFVVVQGFLAAC